MQFKHDISTPLPPNGVKFAFNTSIDFVKSGDAKPFSISLSASSSSASCPADAAGAGVNAMEAHTSVVAEMVCFVAAESTALTVRIVEETVIAPITIIERSIIAVVETVISDRSTADTVNRAARAESECHDGTNDRGKLFHGFLLG